MHAQDAGRDERSRAVLSRMPKPRELILACTLLGPGGVDTVASRAARAIHRCVRDMQPALQPWRHCTLSRKQPSGSRAREAPSPFPAGTAGKAHRGELALAAAVHVVNVAALQVDKLWGRNGAGEWGRPECEGCDAKVKLWLHSWFGSLLVLAGTPGHDLQTKPGS